MDEVLKVALAEPLPPPLTTAAATATATVDEADDTRMH
jgi:hypothetical protein